MVLKRDNTKLKNITNISIFFVLDYSTGYYLLKNEIEREMEWRERDEDYSLVKR